MESKVYNADCLEGMKQYPDKWFDLAVVDPPYGIGVSKMAYLTENKTTVLQKNGTRIKPRKTIFKKSNWDNSTPEQHYYNELCRISKNQIIFGIEYYSWRGVGVGRIKWNKCVPQNLSFKKYELAYCSLIENEIEVKILHSGFNRAKSLSEPTSAQKDFRKIPPKIHPTEKPILLYDWLYINYLPNGGRVIDTHLGSGSNRIAADKAGNIDFTAFEIDKDYFDAQEKRFRDYKAQGVLF